MDLLQTVRKEGSRGGRADFKWSDVQASSHRENYLGHSIKAPVGRWQKNKDLSWYAKGANGKHLSEQDVRREEIRKIKEAEEDALAKALGYDVPPRNEAQNPNTIILGSAKRSQDSGRESGETKEVIEEEEGGKGLGYSEVNSGKCKSEKSLRNLDSQNTLKGDTGRNRSLQKSERSNSNLGEKLVDPISRGRVRDERRQRNIDHKLRLPKRPPSRSRSRSRSRRYRRSRSPRHQLEQNRDILERHSAGDQHYRRLHDEERINNAILQTRDEPKRRVRRRYSPDDRFYRSDRHRRTETDSF